MATKPPRRFVDWYGSSRAQNWGTPEKIFDRLNEQFGFTLDGASEPGNGLLPLASTAARPIPWNGHRVFCNPPWSNILPFVEQAPNARIAVFLVPSRTNARWFHRALQLGAMPRFFLGKPTFRHPDGDTAAGNCPADCLLLVFDRQRAAMPALTLDI